VALALSMSVYLEYCNLISISKFIKWDVKTITAGDYTVQFDIDKQFYRDFQII
jgi:hypothetical protein